MSEDEVLDKICLEADNLCAGMEASQEYENSRFGKPVNNDDSRE